MKWIVFTLAVSLFSAGALVVRSTAGPEPPPPESQAKPEPKPEPKDEDFIPSEKVPADSAISFPVDI